MIRFAMVWFGMIWYVFNCNWFDTLWQ